MELKHFTRNVRIAPRKLRFVTDQVVHMTAAKAIAILPLVNKGGALHVEKALKAAVRAAADQNLNTDTLLVQRISVDEGTAMKRAVSHSKGRQRPIMKKYSHINIVLTGELFTTQKATSRKVAATATPEETPVTTEEK